MADQVSLVIVSGVVRKIATGDTLLVGAGIKSSTGGLSIAAASGSVTFANPIAMGTNKITGLGTPTISTDAATMGYVDGSVGTPGFTENADVALTAGEVIAFSNGTNGPVVKAEADGAGTLVNAYGYCVTGAAQGAPAKVANNGKVTVADALWEAKPVAADIGKRVYMSETAGKSSLTPPATTGSTSLCVGEVCYADASADTTRVAIGVGEPVIV